MATIFVVDPDGDICELHRQFLADAGHRVDTTIGGEGALEAMIAARPDLIITEIEVPGYHRLDFVRTVRKTPAFRNTPLLVLSVDAFERDRIASIEAGADEYRPKPTHWTELVALVGQLLASSTASPAGMPV